MKFFYYNQFNALFASLSVVGFISMICFVSPTRLLWALHMRKIRLTMLRGFLEWPVAKPLDSIPTVFENLALYS